MGVVETATGRVATGPAADRRWVIGIDGSNGAADALAWAVANAGGRATALELVTAWQSPSISISAMASVEVVDIDDTSIESAAAANVMTLAERVRSGLDLPIEAAVGRGSPAEVLLEAASNASLLVVGSRGRGGFARLLLGSTSTQCATHAPVPTVVVPVGVDRRAAQRVLVGVDGSANSLAALRWAVRFASPDATVTAAWVWDASPLAVGSDAFFFPDASELACERFDYVVEPVAVEADAADVPLECEFVRGTPRAVLAEYAEDSDLVVLGARGHGAIGSAILGSVSTWMLHHADRPVAIVPLRAGDTCASTAP